MVYVGDCFTRPFPLRFVEHDELAVAENDVVSCKGGVFAGFAVEGAGHGDGAAGGHSAGVVDFGGDAGVGDFPFARVLADKGLHFFVDVQFSKVCGPGPPR